MIKVLIVDDSALVWQTLKEILGGSSDIRVVGMLLPRMDGVTFLKNLMRLRPMPVVAISTLNEAGACRMFSSLSICLDEEAEPVVQSGTRGGTSG